MEFAFSTAVILFFAVSAAMVSSEDTSAQFSPSFNVPLVRIAVTLSPMVLKLDRSNFHVLSSPAVFTATTTTFPLSGSYAASVSSLEPIIVYPGRIYLDNWPYA